MVAPLLVIAAIAAIGAIGVGVGAAAGGAIGDISENIADTLDVSVGEDGKPSFTVALQEVLATPAIVAPLVTVAIMQSASVLKSLAGNPELPKIMAIALMSLSKKQRKQLFTEVS